MFLMIQPIFRTCDSLFQPDEGPCYVIFTQNSNRKFFEFDDAYLQSFQRALQGFVTRSTFSFKILTLEMLNFFPCSLVPHTSNSPKFSKQKYTPIYLIDHIFCSLPKFQYIFKIKAFFLVLVFFPLHFYNDMPQELLLDWKFSSCPPSNTKFFKLKEALVKFTEYIFWYFSQF